MSVASEHEPPEGGSAITIMVYTVDRYGLITPQGPRRTERPKGEEIDFSPWPPCTCILCRSKRST